MRCDVRHASLNTDCRRAERRNMRAHERRLLASLAGARNRAQGLQQHLDFFVERNFKLKTLLAVNEKKLKVRANAAMRSARIRFGAASSGGRALGRRLDLRQSTCRSSWRPSQPTVKRGAR